MITQGQNPLFDHPEFPINRKAIAEYVENREIERAKREFWFKIKFSLCLLGSVGFGSFLFFFFIFSAMPAR